MDCDALDPRGFFKTKKWKEEVIRLTGKIQFTKSQTISLYFPAASSRVWLYKTMFCVS